MDKQNMEIILISMEDAIQKLSPGNVAHNKASLLWAVRELLEELKGNS